MRCSKQGPGLEIVVPALSSPAGNGSQTVNSVEHQRFQRGGQEYRYDNSENAQNDENFI